MARPDSYSRTQILLHWAIAALVLFQLIFHDGIEEAWRTRFRGGEPGLINPHVIVGLAILALVIWRLALRMTRGVPLAPVNEPAPLQWVASITHWAFYALLFLMPVSGIALWFFEVRAAGVTHEIGKNILIVLVTLHVAAALAHHFWFRSNVFRRMLGRA